MVKENVYKSEYELRVALKIRLDTIIDEMIVHFGPYMRAGFHFPSVYSTADFEGGRGIIVSSKYSYDAEDVVKEHPDIISVWSVMMDGGMEAVKIDSPINVIYQAIRAYEFVFDDWSERRVEVSENLRRLCGHDPIPQIFASDVLYDGGVGDDYFED